MQWLQRAGGRFGQILQLGCSGSAKEMNVAHLLAGPAQHLQSAGGPGGVGCDLMVLTALGGQLG